MSRHARWLTMAAVTLGAVALCGFASQTTEMADVIATRTARYDALAAIRGAERFPAGAQLMRIHGGKATPLVEGFAATADAAVSFDAKSVLFAGKKNATDKWQIWQLTFADGSVRKVVEVDGDAIRPLWLPFNHLVYARSTPRGYQMETATTEGKETQRISYAASSVLPVTVLSDGRILFEIAQTNGAAELYLVYSDGSGVESYRCDHGAARWGGRQMASGDVVFARGGSLGRFSSAQASEVAVQMPRGEFADGPLELTDGSWLVSARTSKTDHYALQAGADGDGALHAVYADPQADVVEPEAVVERPRPRQHPTALHPWSYANMLALDARQSRMGDLKSAPPRVRLEMLEDNGKVRVMGTAPVESDGSFFVTVPGDRPIRFALVDAKGATVRAEHGWFWIRAGEQRICVGCHVGPERASENTVPAVLLKTTTPVDLSGMPSAQQAGGK